MRKAFCYKLLFPILLLLQFHSNIFGQLSFFYDQKKYELPSNSLHFYTESSHDHSFDHFRAIEDSMLPYPQHKFNNSYKNLQVWIRLDLKGLNNSGALENIMIRNPHINYVSAWLLKENKLVKAFTPTGDRTDFYTRPIPYSDFIFPLPKDSLERYSVILMLDKRNELIHIPVHFLSSNGLVEYNRSKNWIAGLFIGICFFLFLFNLFLYINLGDRLYIFYGIYVLLGFLYIYSDMGLTFMYLFPHYPLLSDFTRPISITLATPIYLFFAIELLRVKENFPNYYKWTKRLLVFYIFLLLGSLVLARDTGPIRVTLSALSYFFLNLLMFVNLKMGWKSWKKKVPYSMYIIIASILLMILVLLFSLFLSGDFADTLINRNLMRIAITTEISILTFVLAHRFKKYKLDSEKLLRRVNEQQESIFKATADYQEKELQRLSSLLHDSVGARLSALRFNLEAGKNKADIEKRIDQAILEVGDLAGEVRRFSHAMSPVLLQQKGIDQALRDNISLINQSGKLNIQYEMIGSLHSASFRYELLIYNIVQELIQNIIKHSGATESIVQLILENNLISLYVEDNGVGFDPGNNEEGLGFSQIKQLITFVKGSVQIDSSPGKGTRISIEFPLLPDETRHPDTHS